MGAGINAQSQAPKSAGKQICKESPEPIKCPFLNCGETLQGRSSASWPLLPNQYYVILNIGHLHSLYFLMNIKT